MSITEVAKAAGVTHGTVSRVINARGGVSEATAKRVYEAMARLGYKPKPAAQRRGRTARPPGLRSGSVCLLLVGAPREVLERPGISTLVGSLEAELRRCGLDMLLTQATGLTKLPPSVVGRKTDGLLLIGEASDTLPVAYRQFPSVWLLSTHTRPHVWADHVLPDNEQIGILAADYLAARGHRDVAFYNEQPQHPGFALRGEAFRAAAQRGGIRCLSLVAERTGSGGVWGFGRSDDSGALVRQLVGSKPRPSGVFVPTDEQVLRLYPRLLQQAVLPGRDLDIVSCDNQDVWLRQLDPRPASVDLNFDLLGRRAVEQLLSRIAHPEQSAGTRILIPPRLIEPTPPREAANSAERTTCDSAVRTSWI